MRSPAGQAILARYGFLEALSMDGAWPALWLSPQVATWATLACLGGHGRGLCAGALALSGRDLIDTPLTLPMVMPPTVLGYYLLVLLGRKGWLGGWLHDTFGINLIFTLTGRGDRGHGGGVPAGVQARAPPSRRWT